MLLLLCKLGSCQKGLASYLPEWKTSFLSSFKGCKFIGSHQEFELYIKYIIYVINSFEAFSIFIAEITPCTIMLCETCKTEMFQGQKPQATTGLPEVLSKLREKSSNLPIYNIKFCANASITLM